MAKKKKSKKKPAKRAEKKPATCTPTLRLGPRLAHAERIAGRLERVAMGLRELITHAAKEDANPVMSSLVESAARLIDSALIQSHALISLSLEIVDPAEYTVDEDDDND